MVGERFRLEWWLPDVALVAAWVTLFYSLFLFQGYQKLFRDSDAGWHIRSGEAILTTWAFPHADPYSFIAAGRPWFAWEWGADVLTGAVHRRRGMTGVAMLYACAIAGGIWLWFRLHWAMGGNFLLACAMAPLLLSTSSIHWLARPHIFSWLFLLGCLLYAERPHGGLRVAEGALIATGSALWANVHASFFLGPLIALVYAGSHLVRPVIWDLDRAAEWRRARWFARAAAIAAGASLINPYGWNLHRHVLQYLGDSDLLARIGEFQSFDFHARGAGQIIAALTLAAAGGVLALTRKRLAHFLLAAALTVTALRSARALPLVALLLLPIANSAITDCLRAARGLAPRFRKCLDAFLAYSDNLRRLDARGGGWAVAWTVPAGLFVLLQAPPIAKQTGFPPDQFPVAAYDAIAQLPPEARLFAPDKYGGYLIYRYDGARKVFFDGRSDLYGGEFLRDYGRMVQVRPGWRREWDSFGFTHALLPNDYSLIPALEAAGWRTRYRDGTATLLERPAALPEGTTK